MKKSIVSGNDQTPGSAARAEGRMGQAVRNVGRRLGAIFHFPGSAGRESSAATGPPGSTPGIESMANLDQPPPPGTVWVRCIDYGPERVETREIPDLEILFREPRPAWSRVRWINVDGLHPYLVNRLRETLGFHTLAAEDVLRTHQRPKLESYDNHLFLVARMLMRQTTHVVDEQVSLFLFRDLVLTFQETRGDVWDPIRQRLQKAGSRLRNLDASYLLYALLDALVDHGFPILEHYGEQLADLEKGLLEEPTPRVRQRLHEIKRELALLRRVMWPMRDLLSELEREEEEISPPVRAYMRDVHDHAVQVMDIVETYREMAASLNDLYMSAVGNRMNEIMKVLTIIATFFIPITFIAGVYGMNFEYIPELHWPYAYATFWFICLGTVASLAIFFRRKGWIGQQSNRKQAKEERGN